MTNHDNVRNKVLPQLRSRRWWPMCAWAVAVLIVATTDWYTGRAAAALLLLCFLPGWACLEAWLPTPAEVPCRVALAGGISIALTGVVTLYLVYLGWPLGKWHMLAVCALVTLPGLVAAQRRRPPALVWPDRRLWLALLLVLLVAATLRLVQLGYAEFHEDEVEVTSLAVRAIKGGESYAVFLHRKGPLQMLLPMAGWLLAGHIDEGWARLPFAVANLLGVLTVSWIAYEAAGGVAALGAGLLLAVNGYLVAYARMVQYQSLVFLLVSLTVLCLWRAGYSGEKRLIWPAMLCMAVGLLAHFDALVFMPVVAYLLWRIWMRWPAARIVVLASGGVAACVALSFFVPYALDPQFKHTAAYLLEDRVGGDWLYNNLSVLWSLHRTYASRFYDPLLLILDGIAVLTFLAAGVPWAWRVAMAVAATGGGLSLWWPEIFHIGPFNLAVAPWLLLALGAFRALRKPLFDKGSQFRHASWFAGMKGGEAFVLWCAAPALAYTFLVKDPRTHVYVMYPGAALIAGLGVAVVWRWAGSLRLLLAGLGGVALALAAAYQVLIFMPTEAALADVRAAWKGSLGAAIYGGLPKPGSYFGYPRLAGWKGGGYLVATGVVPDDFRSVGIEFSVPVWYAFETPRSCYEDADLYMVAKPADRAVGLPESLPTARYAQVATIMSEGRPRLQLWQKDAPRGIPAVYDLAELAKSFDALATPDRFSRASHSGVTLDLRFGDVARLTGFGLVPQPVSGAAQAAPGDTLVLRLYWLSLSPTDTAYRAFVHLGENPVQAQQDDNPACRLPTSLWRTGQSAVGQFRVSVPVQAPSGSYPLLVGLYDPATMQRLPVVDGQGQPAGDAVQLATIEVGSP